MAVYVDDMRAPYGRLILCHMVADTLDELHEMADRIGVARKWFQGQASWPHYDIVQSKRMLAIAHGAVPVTRRELVGIIKRLRHALLVDSETDKA